MAESEEKESVSVASMLGTGIAMLTTQFGAALAFIGAMFCGAICLEDAMNAQADKWQLYLVAGGIFVVVLACCKRAWGKV